MSAVCQRNKEKKRNTSTHLLVKEVRQNIVSLLSYKRNTVFFPLPFSPHLNPAVGFCAPRLNLAFSPRVKVAKSRRGAEGGGFGSPLAGFLPNTEVT
jgi:hypothetical protein